jgi:DNA-binding NarL/FixJ family response regulator
MTMPQSDPNALPPADALASRRVRLVIADDHKVLLEGLVSLLKEEEGIEVVGQAVNGRKALEEIQRLRPDVALLDISMPEMSGLEVTRQVTTRFHEVKVLILTMHEEEAFFFEALRSGASGYVLKGASGDELLAAILAVHEGGVYLPPKLAGIVLRDY